MRTKKKYFDVVDREILVNLLKLEKIDWYYFHEKYLLSPGQLSRSIKKLEKWKFVIVEDKSIKITEQGRRNVISDRNIILRKNQNEHWKLVQEERMGIKLKINEFYLPNKSKLDI